MKRHLGVNDEGYDPSTCAFPIRIMKLFGVEKLALTNAAGGLNKNVSCLINILLSNVHSHMLETLGHNTFEVLAVSLVIRRSQVGMAQLGASQDRTNTCFSVLFRLERT